MRIVKTYLPKAYNDSKAYCESIFKAEDYQSISCLLCRFTDDSDSNNKTCTIIKSYIVDNISSIDLDELCSQVVTELQDSMTDNEFASISANDVKTHITQHMLNSNVVMTNILKDLLKLSNVARDSCTTIEQDTGHAVVNVKMLSAYIKTVETIAAIYRSNNSEKTK